MEKHLKQMWLIEPVEPVEPQSSIVINRLELYWRIYLHTEKHGPSEEDTLAILVVLECVWGKGH